MTLSRAEVEALTAGDHIRVGQVTYEVIRSPKRTASHPLMVHARPADDPNAMARSFQLGVHRMERIDHFACGHEECDMEPCQYACDDCGRTDGTHDMDIEH